MPLRRRRGIGSLSAKYSISTRTPRANWTWEQLAEPAYDSDIRYLPGVVASVKKYLVVVVGTWYVVHGKQQQLCYRRDQCSVESFVRRV